MQGGDPERGPMGRLRTCLLGYWPTLPHSQALDLHGLPPLFLWGAGGVRYITLVG